MHLHITPEIPITSPITSAPSYMQLYADRLLDNGYTFLPIAPGTKIPGAYRPNKPPREGLAEGWDFYPAWNNFSKSGTSQFNVNLWKAWPGAGIGLVTGKTFGIDIDVLDADLAYRIAQVFFKYLGETPAIRIGKEPKMMLVYRTETPFRGWKYHPLEVLADGQQFVAYATHPDTQKPYKWVDESLADIPLSDLPCVTEPNVRAAMDEAFALIPSDQKPIRLSEPTDTVHETNLDLVGTPEAISDAMQFISNDNVGWDDWNRIGMALYTSTEGSGFDLFDEFSKQSDKYDAATTKRAWNGYKRSPPKSIGAGTIYHLAQRHGWIPDAALPFNENKKTDGVDLDWIIGDGSKFSPLTSANDAHGSRPDVFWHGDGSELDCNEELISGILPAGEVALLSGASTSGKTFAALAMSYSLATGEPFCGHKIRRRGGALCLAGEGFGTLKRRLKALSKSNSGRHPGQLPIAVHALRGTLNEKGQLQAVLELARSVNLVMKERFGVPLTMIIIDTIAAAFSLPDENDASAATAAMRILQKIHGETGALVVGVAHHGKNIESGVRGSSAWTASADAILSVNVKKSTTGKVLSREISLTKSRDRDTGWSCQFELSPVVLGIDSYGEEVISAYFSPVDISAITNPQQSVSKAPSKQLDCLIGIIRAAAVGVGRAHSPVDKPDAVVAAVYLDDVRSAFYSALAADGTPNIAAQRQALNRRIQEGKSLGMLDFDGTDSKIIWLTENTQKIDGLA